MLYREVGQFKTTYGADQAIFPIAQDRWFVFALIAFAFLAVPLFAGQYLYTEVLIPVLILSIAAIGLNILTGYCGQLSLGTGGFMAVGTPERVIDEVVRQGKRDLTIIANDTARPGQGIGKLVDLQKMAVT